MGLDTAAPQLPASPCNGNLDVKKGLVGLANILFPLWVPRHSPWGFSHAHPLSCDSAASSGSSQKFLLRPMRHPRESHPESP